MALFQGKDADLVTDYWARLPEDPSIFAKEQSRVTGKQLWEEMGECSPGAPVSHLHWVSETVTPIKLGAQSNDLRVPPFSGLCTEAAIESEHGDYAREL